MFHGSPEDSRYNWAHLYEGLEASTLDFYQQVEMAVAKRSISEVVIERIEYSEGGVLSDRRQYLRVRRRRDLFDICGAPFGNAPFQPPKLGSGIADSSWTCVHIALNGVGRV